MELNKNTENLSETRLLKLTEILKLIPVSASTWKKGVREGTLPQPMRIADSVNLWRAKDINDFIEHGSQVVAQPTAQEDL